MSTSEQQENQTLQIPIPSTPGRIRSHSLKPQHSRIDYERRRSANDISSSTSFISCLESSTDDNDIDDIQKIPSPSWFKRRFTLFSFEQPINPQNQRRMTTDRFSFFDAELLKQKRPSFIAQMMEVEFTSLLLSC